MIVYDVISEYPGVENVKESYIKMRCTVRSLNPDAVFTASMERLTELVIADCLSAMVNLPDFTEGDLSETQSKELLKSANILYDKHGALQNSTPTVTGRNPW